MALTDISISYAKLNNLLNSPMVKMEKLLFLEHVDHRELLQVLLGWFGHCESIGKNAFMFSRRNVDASIDPRIHLSITVDKNDVIKQIEPSEALSGDMIKDISISIKESLLDSTPKAVGRFICFAHQPVKEYYRYPGKESFVILPVPSNAPHIEPQYGDHPFMIEFEYKSVKDHMVDYGRRRDKALRITRCLNLLVNGEIFLESNNAQHVWVHAELPNGQWTSEWRQKMYTYEGFNGKTDQFSNTGSLAPIPLISPDPYYSEYGVRSETLTLPDNITHLLNIAFGLSFYEHATFLQACTLLQQSSAIWLDSQSLSFLALVMAIESLVQESSAKWYERLWRRWTPGPTRLFREFIEVYFPQIDRFPKEKQMIYKTRSKIVHGSSLMGRDLFSMTGFLSKKSEAEYGLHTRCRLIVLSSIRNWLRKRGGLKPLLINEKSHWLQTNPLFSVHATIK